MGPKDVDRMVNSEDTDQSSLIWSALSAQILSVRKLRIITVHDLPDYTETDLNKLLVCCLPTDPPFYPFPIFFFFFGHF